MKTLPTNTKKKELRVKRLKIFGKTVFILLTGENNVLNIVWKKLEENKTL